MRQSNSPAIQSVQRRPRVVARTYDRQPMMRGLVNGVILSILIWAAAGYLTFILR